jgi:hypothetical protein
VFQPPVVNVLDPAQQGKPVEYARAPVDPVPDTFPLWINLAGSPFSGPSTGAVPETFGAALRADESGVAQDAFPASLTPEHRNFNDILQETGGCGNPPLSHAQRFGHPSDHILSWGNHFSAGVPSFVVFVRHGVLHVLKMSSIY